MTEVEMMSARRVYELQTKRNPFKRLVGWARSLGTGNTANTRRARLGKKAEVERKAREAL